jgi:hypothetical protein
MILGGCSGPEYATGDRVFILIEDKWSALNDDYIDGVVQAVDEENKSVIVRVSDVVRHGRKAVNPLTEKLMRGRDGPLTVRLDKVSPYSDGIVRFENGYAAIEKLKNAAEHIARSENQKAIELLNEAESKAKSLTEKRELTETIGLLRELAKSEQFDKIGRIEAHYKELARKAAIARDYLKYSEFHKNWIQRVQRHENEDRSRFRETLLQKAAFVALDVEEYKSFQADKIDKELLYDVDRLETLRNEYKEYLEEVDKIERASLRTAHLDSGKGGDRVQVVADKRLASAITQALYESAGVYELDDLPALREKIAELSDVREQYRERLGQDYAAVPERLESHRKQVRGEFYDAKIREAMARDEDRGAKPLRSLDRASSVQEVFRGEWRGSWVNRGAMDGEFTASVGEVGAEVSYEGQKCDISWQPLKKGKNQIVLEQKAGSDNFVCDDKHFGVVLTRESADRAFVDFYSVTEEGALKEPVSWGTMFRLE